MAWPDLHKLAVSYLSDTLGVRVSTRTPADLESQLPMLRVIRGPGADDGVTDAPLLDVDAFAGTQQEAWNLAEATRQALHALRGRAVDGVLVDAVTTAVSPQPGIWENPRVERFQASYRIAMRQLISD